MSRLNTKSMCIDDKSLIVDFPKIPRVKITEPRKVTFSPTSTMHQYYPHENDSSEQDGDCCTWFKKSDYNSFRRNTKIEVAIARQILEEFSRNDGNNRGSYEICSTGIEDLMSPEILLKILELRNNHIHGVLQEQSCQRYHGVQDQCALRSVSKVHSKQSKTRAWMCAGGRVQHRHSLQCES